MNTSQYLAAGSIKDPDFIYVFFGQVILFALIWLAGVYAFYRIFTRMFPKLNKYICLVVAFVSGIIVVSLLGLITQMLRT